MRSRRDAGIVPKSYQLADRNMVANVHHFRFEGRKDALAVHQVQVHAIVARKPERQIFLRVVKSPRPIRLIRLNKIVNFILSFSLSVLC
jgi:hypothetical protein